MHQRCRERAVWFLLCFAIQIISQGLFPPRIKVWLSAKSTDTEKYLRIYLHHREPACRLCVLLNLCYWLRAQTLLAPRAHCADVPSIPSTAENGKTVHNAPLGCLRRRAAKPVVLWFLSGQAERENLRFRLSWEGAGNSNDAWICTDVGRLRPRSETHQYFSRQKLCSA